MKTIVILVTILSAVMTTLHAQTTVPPMFVRSGTTADPTTMKTITWMTDPTDAPKAVMKLAKKTDGAGSFREITGKTMNIEYDTYHTGSGPNPKIPKIAYSVTAEGLEPGTNYICQAGDGTIWSETMEFTTTAVTNKLSFFVLGDLQAYSNNIMDISEGGTVWLRTIADIYKNPATRPMFTVQTGDLTEREHVYKFYKLFGDVCDDYPEFANTDMVFAMGEKEYQRGVNTTNFNGEGRGEISKFLNGTPPVTDAGAIGSGTYSVDYGNVHVITLDFAGRGVAGLNAADIISAQAQWLRRDLENCDKTWKIVSVHYPVFKDGTEANPYPLAETAFGSIFDEFGVQLVFSGHYHYIRRIQVKDGVVLGKGLMSAVQPGGTIYMSCGSITDNTDQTAPGVNGFSSVYIKCDVDDDKLTLTMTNQYNVIRDKFTINATLEEVELPVSKVTFESLHPGAGTLEAYTGGYIGGFDAGNAQMGRLNGGTKLEPGTVHVRNGSVFFVATPEYGWRVKRFIVNGQPVANRISNSYIRINDEGVSSGGAVIATAHNNTGKLDNSMPGLVYGVTSNDAPSRTGGIYAAEIIEIPVSPGESSDVKVEFEKELAVYSEITVSHINNNADKNNYHPSKYAVVSGPSAWWPAAGNGVDSWIEFAFDEETKSISEIRLYTRNGVNRATEVRLDFYRNNAVVHTQTTTLTADGGAVNSVKLAAPVIAGKVRITQTKTDTGNANAGFQRIQILETVIPASSVTVSSAGNATVIAADGGVLQMQAVVQPADATNQSVTWSLTPATGVADVSNSGLLAATGNGKVIVRATANDGSGKYDEKEIEISGQIVPVSSVMINGAEGATAITVNGGALQMEAFVLPVNAVNKAVTWSVNPAAGVAVISENGLLTATGNGTVTVKAAALDGSGVVSNELQITVANQKTPEKPVIASVSMTNGVQGTPYYQYITTYSELPVTWSIENGQLPAGLNVNPETGLISGTPSVAGEFSFTVKAANNAGEDRKQLTLTITATTAPITYTVTFGVASGNGAIEAMADGNGIANGAEINAGKNIVFTATPDNGYRIRQWKLNGAVIPNAISDRYTLTNLTAASMVTVDFDATTDVEEANAPELKLYPNPVRANAGFTVGIDGNNAVQGLIEMFNSAGTPVMKIQTGDSIIRLTAPCLPGVYILRYTTDKHSRIYRIVID